MKVALAFIGLTGAVVTGVVALFTFGDAAAFATTGGVLAATVVGLVGSRRTTRMLLPLIAVLMIGAVVYAGWGIASIARALSVTTGSAMPANPVDLAAATAKLDALDGLNAFRLELMETELTAVVQEALADPERESPLQSVVIDIVDGENGEQGHIDFVAAFKSGTLSASGSLSARLDGEALHLNVLEIEIGVFALPGLAKGAIEDMVREMLGVNDILSESGADLDSLLIGNDRLVITGITAGQIFEELPLPEGLAGGPNKLGESQATDGS